MEFARYPVLQSLGLVLGHNVYDETGRRLLRKGQRIDAQTLESLNTLGIEQVYAARLDTTDVGEDEAALWVSRAACGPGVRLVGPRTGRVNWHAEQLGVVRVDVTRLRRLNDFPELTLATVRNHSVAAAGKIVATTKVLPYAVAQRVLMDALESISMPTEPNHPKAAHDKGHNKVHDSDHNTGHNSGHNKTVWLDPLPHRRVSLVVGASPGALEKTAQGFSEPLRLRLEGLGSELSETIRVEFSKEPETAMAAALARCRDQEVDLILVAGDTAIQDAFDLIPAALRRAGGEAVAFGAPVDPGNLLFLGYLNNVAVLGAPGCARSMKTNIVDLVLPRLLVGDRLSRDDLLDLAHGGLLEDVPERPMPRERV